MAYTLVQFETRDYDKWKERFDTDPAGRKEIAKGYMIFRGVDDPRKVFVGVEFGSVEDARTFSARLLGSGALDSPDWTAVMPPTVVEVADRAEYELTANVGQRRLAALTYALLLARLGG